MLIEEKKLKHWVDNFYGYGSWQASTWFIDYEEGGGDTPEEVAEKFNYFFENAQGSQATLCDIRELYKHVSFRVDGPKAEKFRNLFEYRFGPLSIPHGVWKNLIAFVFGNRNKKLRDVLAYQKTSLAVPNGSEALITLYPLPSPHNHAWYYSWLDMPTYGFLKSRALYEDHLFESRMKTILGNIGTHKPEVVLMYGMNNINTLKKTVQDFFPGVEFRLVKAIERQIPQHHKANIGGTVLVITTQVPALRHNRIETGFDWEKFGKAVASGS